MSPLGRLRRRVGWRFPRVSGDEPECGDLLGTVEEFSPRERG